MKRDKFIIIDGNSLANRAFYAIPLLSNSKGIITNAVYGFNNMLIRIIENEKPSFLAVAFDKSRKVFRNDLYEDYKANRKAMPTELRSQMDLIKELLKAFNITYYEKEGFEADDLIGTIIKYGENQNWENLILTGDRDALQLVSDQTKVLLTKKGITNLEIYDVDAIKEKYNLKPAQIIDLKGLMGDTSDNIPGVPGVGEKTALKLLHEYESVENLYNSLGEITAKKLGEKLTENKEMAFISKELATINCEVEMDIKVEDLALKEYNPEALLDLYRELEFQNHYRNISTEQDPQTSLPEIGESISNSNILEEILQLNTEKKLIFMLTFDPKDVKGLHPKGMGLLINEKAYFIRFENDFSRYAEVLKPYLENNEITKVTHDVKKAKVCFMKENIHIEGLEWDILIGAYLLDPTQNDLSIEGLISKYLNNQVEKTGNEIFMLMHGLKDLSTLIINALEEDLLMRLYLDIELPLVQVLAKMEMQGVKLDRIQLEEMGKDLSERIEVLTSTIYRWTNEEFNINSPKQLGVVLFEKLGLPIIKKTKTGYSTDAEVLEELAREYQIVNDIIHYRQLVKLKSTYVDGMLNIIDPRTEKVHTSFNQTVTATGRLSSTEPNLQNIPIRLDEGRKIRKAFIPSEEGYILLAADYSQIELRILAHISEDQVLIEAFKQGQDIHRRTASEVFGVPIEEVTTEQRRHAKAINFGIIYGLSDFGLAKDLGITRLEAKNYIDNYFSRYYGVKTWIDSIIEKAREQGYVTTLLERRRYLKDILSKNNNLRKFAERTAMNTPIQGSAADIIKLAMIRIDEKLEQNGFKAKMLVQVHDELVFEIPPNESSRVITIIKESMEEAYPLEVPLTIDMQVGFNWYEMESI
ncbi:DNA polymerase I [Desulfonispora thiosulfatigenes DSM 11270]|uniref:DNA polymerase I n=1 Tax=Desulfonispora thiosulfatigenes DSM 11270 TaxID=656914 RepID=A0A1W1VHW3_DESTI|nr:DNA polymerase I [Desulfonispora thiosulfatigenes]SMB92916.1 DNA polymerase I [Desulfonispora thiosulfatigenes DSM 11270]